MGSAEVEQRLHILARMSFACTGLGKEFRTRRGVTPALEDVSLAVGKGEFVCVVGPSGCGKTTLLKLIAGLLPATTGRITFDGDPHATLVFQEHGIYEW